MRQHIVREPVDILPQIVPGLQFLMRRRMLLPVLLFVAAHRPLAFVIGQSLLLCTPIELLLSGSNLEDWALLLSHPQGGSTLLQMMEDALVEEPNRPVEQVH